MAGCTVAPFAGAVSEEVGAVFGSPPGWVFAPATAEAFVLGIAEASPGKFAAAAGSGVVASGGGVTADCTGAGTAGF